MRVSKVGLMVRLKSGETAAAVTVRAREALWVSEPDFPVMVMVELPGADEDEAVTVIFCATPGVSESVEGLVVTPSGRPLTVTEIEELNPLLPVASMEKVCPAPAAIVSVETEAETVKFAGVETCGVEELLHADRVTSTMRRAAARTVLESTRIFRKERTDVRPMSSMI